MISSGTAITVSNASQVAAIKKDTLVIITGSTRLFTVDTPEDQGLVATKPGMQEILRQIKAKDGSAQQYYFTGKDGAKKDNGEILDGDHLVVISQDNRHQATYVIATQPMAKSGRLRIEKMK